MAQFRAKSSVSFRTRDFHVTTTMAITVGRVASSARSVPEDRRAQTVQAELATYTTSAELRDLEATLDLYADDETDEIRSMLADQAMSRLVNPRASGPLG